MTSHILRGDPAKLLFIATGNIPKEELLVALERHFDHILQGLSDSGFVELGREALVVHG